jgi:3-phosphoshikimate 1-carboxyvinyltransferase
MCASIRDTLLTCLKESTFMMQVTIYPSTLSGSVVAHASKSAMQRACAAALVKKGTTMLYNSGRSNDEVSAINTIQQLGARVVTKKEGILIQSLGVRPVSSDIQCGESGLSLRLFTPIAALSQRALTLKGEGSLLKRPMHFFDDILPQLGVQINSTNGHIPLNIKGPLRANTICTNGSLSSQFLTGLLMTYATLDDVSATIHVDHLNSKPYIDLTLAVINAFGLNTPVNNHYKSFVFKKKKTTPSHSPIQYTVEGDWSGAAFILIAGAVAGNSMIKGLDLNSTQADKKILDALIACGSSLSITAESIKTAPSSMGLQGLKPFQFDATDCPDLFPPLVALAAHCQGISVIQGVSRLVHKESNRGVTLQKEMSQFGVDILLENDVMIIKGGTPLRGATVHSHNDHRIAMACAIVALNAEGRTIIKDADAINKSYPDFYTHLKQLGARVDVNSASINDN